MKIPLTHALKTAAFSAALAGVCFVLLAGCGSEQRASDMTSYSSKEAKSDQAALFTIPQEQMSHVQVVTVQPTRLTRTLRLTGAVAYNAFKTTPVITQVGGPVSRILVVPGQNVKVGQPMLEVSSPDYSQLLDAYLLRINDGHQRLDERRPFGSSNWGKLELHTFQDRKATPDQLRFFTGLLRSYGSTS